MIKSDENSKWTTAPRSNRFFFYCVCFVLGAASVARAWSGFFDSMFDNIIRNTTISVLGELHETLLGKFPDVFAFFVCLLHACVLGKRASS